MKRFTESSKWNDPWFRKLPLTHKLYWFWLLDNCDCAGIIEPDLELARFMLGASEGLPSPKEAFGDRIEQAGEKFLILKFIRYQYGDSLNPANNAHRGVLKRLESSEFKEMKHLFDGKKKSPKLAPSEGLVRSCQAPQDKDKDKDKDKDQKKERESSSLDVEEEVFKFWNSFPQLPKIIRISKERKAKMRTRLKDSFFRDNWRKGIEQILSRPFLIGQNERGWKADIEWFMQPDSLTKIMEGKYTQTERGGKGKSTIDDLMGGRTLNITTIDPNNNEPDDFDDDPPTF